MTVKTAPTTQADLDYARSVCAEMTDGFKFEAEDIDGPLLRGATEYARQYTGFFDFMLKMKFDALRKGWLSEGQAKGVLNCLFAEVKRNRRPVAPVEVVDFTGLRALFAKAAEHLQKPRIVLSMGRGMEALTIKLMTAGGHVGSISFQTGTFDDGTWFGRVETDGKLTPSKYMTPQVRELIDELAADPIAAARRHAHLTGNCCFCSRKLDDERSTAAGYGPVCADNYGLPWGQE
jgi:hypothetical protein